MTSIADWPRRRASSLAAVVSDDYREIVNRDDLDVIDVCTPSHTHFELSMAALEAGKHVLCEKPRGVRLPRYPPRRGTGEEEGPQDETRLYLSLLPSDALHEGTGRRGVLRSAIHLQRLRAELTMARTRMVPLRQVDLDADQSQIQVSSLEGYGAPVIDLARYMVGAELTSVIGTMKNFIPERMVRATGTMMPMNIDDGDIFIAEFANGAIGSVQTSFVTVGNYPGIEVRLTAPRGRSSRAWSRSWNRRDDQGSDSGRRRVQGT